MKTPFTQLALVCLLTLTTTCLRAAEEQDLIAILQSKADAPQKWAACQRLRLVGSPQAVPALAALLTDERGSQAARHALEGLPYPEAGAALRDALPATNGRLKAGLLDSLGWRAESASVPSILQFLSDADEVIAASAAAALGRIGGPEAISALAAARETAPAAVQPTIQESLLKCAERLLAAKDNPGAALIYRDLYVGKLPVQVRTAAWRGIAWSETATRPDFVLKALTGKDRPIQFAALKVLRELDDRAVVKACVDRWASLSPVVQLGVLEADVKLGAEALPIARLAGASPEATLRIGAWKALGELNDSQSIPALAKAAAQGDPAEREAARDSLAQLRGLDARAAFLTQVDQAASPEKAELLRALGERDDRSSVPVLLQNAASDDSPVRLAALDSLRRLAPPESIKPLLDIAAKSKSDEQRDPVLKALYAVVESSSNKDTAARSIVEALGRFPANERRQILPLLSELATPDAFNAAQAASRDPDLELSKEAVRVLGQWPNAAPAPTLLELARTSPEPTLRTLALRGAIDVSGQESDLAKRLAFLQEAFTAARGVEEKKQVLGQVGQIPSAPALDLALKSMNEPALASEARLASIAIAEKLAPSNPKLADTVAASVLAQVNEGDIARRAWALRVKPSSGASFIRDWLVCGPYRQPGINGAQAVFSIPFGPEKPGQKIEWISASPADHVNLLALFPGAENCAAYLRTHIVAEQDSPAVLLLGSDDGIKAWLNGQVVLSSNVDRGEVADQDAAPIKLRKGTNELVLKISQGGGGWSACARIVGQDGKPITGLLIERPTVGAQPLSLTPAKPAPAGF